MKLSGMQEHTMKAMRRDGEAWRIDQRFQSWRTNKCHYLPGKTLEALEKRGLVKKNARGNYVLAESSVLPTNTPSKEPSE